MRNATNLTDSRIPLCNLRSSKVLGAIIISQRFEFREWRLRYPSRGKGSVSSLFASLLSHLVDDFAFNRKEHERFAYGAEP